MQGKVRKAQRRHPNQEERSRPQDHLAIPGPSTSDYQSSASKEGNKHSILRNEPRKSKERENSEKQSLKLQRKEKEIPGKNIQLKNSKNREKREVNIPRLNDGSLNKEDEPKRKEDRCAFKRTLSPQTTSEGTAPNNRRKIKSRKE